MDSARAVGRVEPGMRLNTRGRGRGCKNAHPLATGLDGAVRGGFKHQYGIRYDGGRLDDGARDKRTDLFVTIEVSPSRGGADDLDAEGDT